MTVTHVLEDPRSVPRRKALETRAVESDKDAVAEESPSSETFRIDGPTPAHPADARESSVAQAVRIALHLGALAGLVAFVLHAVYDRMTSAAGFANAVLVGDPLREIAAPVPGRFVAVNALTEGAPVVRGQVLGRIVDTDTEERLSRARWTLQSLRERRLQAAHQRAFLQGVDQQAASTLDRELRDLTTQIRLSEDELATRRNLLERLTIRSPDSGRIHFGLRGSMAVEAHETIASVWPQNGRFLLRISAPLEAIDEIIREGRAAARFETPDGIVTVTAIPLPESRRTDAPDADRRRTRDELWGTLQCRPVSVPAAARTPGLVGRLH